MKNRESPDFKSLEVGIPADGPEVGFRLPINTQNISFISLSFGTAVVQEKQAFGWHYKGHFKARTVKCCSLRQEE